MADVGLVGFPSAGKSSLISVLSAAKPKIGDYPFTTLQPNLGVVDMGDSSFTIADVPGLIPGAADGKGLGLDFLRHIERTAVLAHVVDTASIEPGRDPESDIEALENELAKYQEALQEDTGLGDLRERPRIIILNKADVPEAEELAEFVQEDLKEKFGALAYVMSAMKQLNPKKTTFHLVVDGQPRGVRRRVVPEQPLERRRRDDRGRAPGAVGEPRRQGDRAARRDEVEPGGHAAGGQKGVAALDRGAPVGHPFAQKRRVGGAAQRTSRRPSRATASAVATWRSMRRERVSRPRFTRNALNGEMAEP